MCRGPSEAHAGAMFHDYDTLRILADEHRNDLLRSAGPRPESRHERRTGARRWHLRRR